MAAYREGIEEIELDHICSDTPIKDYYDIMIVGKRGMGKSTTADKMLIANPNGEKYLGQPGMDPIRYDSMGCIQHSDMYMWHMSNEEDEIERISKWYSERLKNLVLYRSLQNPHNEVNASRDDPETYGSTEECELLSNDSTKIRVMDVRGFRGSEVSDWSVTQASTKSDLSIMRKILYIKMAKQFRFHRIIYFLPVRGVLSRENQTLQTEIGIMEYYLGRSIFESMVVVATYPAEMYKFLNKSDDLFPNKDAEKTRHFFQLAMERVFGCEDVPQPPIIFISQFDTCEEILHKVKHSRVSREGVELKFNPSTCARCNIRISKLDGDQNDALATCTYNDWASAIPYEDSTCHPMMIPKYSKVQRIVGEIAHAITFKHFPEKWAHYESFEEVCINCRQRPESRGCMRVNSTYIDRKHAIKVDHTSMVTESCNIEIGQPWQKGLGVAQGDNESNIPSTVPVVHSDSDYTSGYGSGQPWQKGLGVAQGDNESNIPSTVPVVHSDSDYISGYGSEYPSFPGIVFYGPPIRESITLAGATILSDLGISLSIPENALRYGEQKDLLIRPCFNGPFELPQGYKSASPAYLIESSGNFDIQREVTIQIHHYANLASEEDCEEMTFLSACRTPQFRQSKPVYSFKEIKHGIFKPNSQVGEIIASHFCYVKIGRRSSNRPSFNEGIYSVRLYRSNFSQSAGVTAVFCMCPFHPLYIKFCDERILKEYRTLSTEREARSDRLVKMVKDEVTLSVTESVGWDAKFDKQPTKIQKRDVDVPSDIDISEFSDYPPKFLIFLHQKAGDTSPPKLQIQGLDVEDCSFEIVTPSSSPPTSLTPSSLLARPQNSQVTEIELCKTLDLFNILTELESITQELCSLAIVLRVETEDIEANYPNNVQKRKEEVVRRWLKTGGSSLSWETLCKALRSKLVRRHDVAKTIENKYYNQQAESL